MGSIRLVDSGSESYLEPIGGLDQVADTPVPVPVAVPDLSGDGDGACVRVPDLPGDGDAPPWTDPRPRFVRNRGLSPVPVPDLLKSGTRL